ncbi:uncharacterized protein NECHADRAFT_82773 [Fusarium vanettenii 77-13-4]|uniref:Serine protease n=1 Tax=Fusarium vanettenii (strain ATCC MYA-4622 / CBS 123669 / FGSC 9596 / NRRL 45880 / 77-13-4) TaxID=660122 RepID=C7YWT1_FUSV7|nr:uncharacterized protein NECHADRAFT_82773 [Fusarium vanettenii 77-13-4]EEU43714.1 predicted protein [Fusarium vanettenii 77-13-4]
MQKMTKSTNPDQPSAQESASSPSNAPKTALKLISKIPGTTAEDIENKAIFSDYLGLSIAPFDQPTHEGTKGVYLRRRDNGAILLLTCRRVVFSDEPGDDTLCKLKSNLQSNIDYEIHLMARLEKESNTPEQLVNLDAKRQRLKPRMALWEQELRKLQELDDPVSRIIGHVVFSPPYGVGATKIGTRHLRDWALIELQQGKHETELTSLRNKIFTGEKGFHACFHAMPRSGIGVKRSLVSFDRLNHAAEVQDTMPEEELRDPRSATPPWNSAIMVIKHGAATGLTIGSVAEAASVVRRTHGNVTLEYEEWCVLREKGRMGEGRREMFSAAGDSGSCVFDSFGRVVGISSGGGREVPESDGGYFAPMEWVLDDIRAHGISPTANNGHDLRSLKCEAKNMLGDHLDQIPPVVQRPRGGKHPALSSSEYELASWLALLIKAKEAFSCQGVSGPRVILNQPYQ